jgi:ABC-type phosphate transport system ATPase subunit
VCPQVLLMDEITVDMDEITVVQNMHAILLMQARLA